MGVGAEGLDVEALALVAGLVAYLEDHGRWGVGQASVEG